MGKVTLHKQRRVFDGFFKIDEVHLSHERFDGTMSRPLTRLCLERGDAVAALVFEPKLGKLLFVEQFRYPSHQRGRGWLTEVVAGMIDKGESPPEALGREMLEELGYEMASTERIGQFFSSPGTSSEQTHLYYVVAGDKKESGGGVDDEDEDLRTLALDPEEALARLAQGDFCDAKTIIAMMWYQANRPQTPGH